jgi:hypothetical protein
MPDLRNAPMTDVGTGTYGRKLNTWSRVIELEALQDRDVTFSSVPLSAAGAIGKGSHADAVWHIQNVSTHRI